MTTDKKQTGALEDLLGNKQTKQGLALVAAGVLAAATLYGVNSYKTKNFNNKFSENSRIEKSELTIRQKLFNDYSEANQKLAEVAKVYGVAVDESWNNIKDSVSTGSGDIVDLVGNRNDYKIEKKRDENRRYPSRRRSDAIFDSREPVESLVSNTIGTLLNYAKASDYSEQIEKLAEEKKELDESYLIANHLGKYTSEFRINVSDANAMFATIEGNSRRKHSNRRYVSRSHRSRRFY